MNWADLLQEGLRAEITRPEGAKTRNELANDWGVSVSTVDRRLRGLREKGLVRGVKGKEFNETAGRSLDVIWYIPVNNKKGK